MNNIKIYCHRLEQCLLTKPLASAFVLGTISALCFIIATPAAIIAPIIGFSGFLRLQQKSQSASPFFLGWWFGFGHFLISLYWIGNALSTVGLWYLYPIGAAGIPIVFAFLIGLITAISDKIKHSPQIHFLTFSLLWSGSEWVRGCLANVFPWNLLGYIWDLNILQITSIIGIYGLSLLTILFVTSFASRRLSLPLLFTTLFIGLNFWGQQRLNEGSTALTGINIRLVQASIPQQQKWLLEQFDQNLDKHLALSLLEAEKPLSLVIWAEASVPTSLLDYHDLRQLLKEATPENGYLIVGAPRIEKVNNQRTYYTSHIILDDKGEMVSFYDKSNLVPFGEYMPGKGILNIKKLTAGSEDYTPGSGIQTIKLPGIPPYSPLICYEAIFSGAVARRDQPPQWLLNQTNDAWYGHSAGPYQHLQIVRVRSIEEGLPLVRCANNGVSAVIDSYGRILYQLALDDVGFIDFDLPKPLFKKPPYTEHGNLYFFIGLTIVSLLILSALTFINKKPGLRGY